MASKTFSVSSRSQVFKAFFAVTCLLAVVQCNSVFKRNPTLCQHMNPLAWCLDNVDFSSPKSKFCDQATWAMSCISKALAQCFDLNGTSLLQALSEVDLAPVYEGHRSVCS